MLNIFGNSERSAGSVGRREFLSIGTSLLGGIGLSDLMRLRSQAAESGLSVPQNDKSVIVLWCHGGMSHLETYDVKTAPKGNSLFGAIGTASPDIQLCELLPRHAKIADKLTILRSLQHDQPDHGWGTRRFVTGSGREMTRGQNSAAYHPAIECGVNRALGQQRQGLPVSVNVGNFHGTPWRGPGVWGSQYGVPQVHANRDGVRGMQEIAMRLPADRMSQRRELQGSLDQLRREVDARGEMAALDSFQQQAWEVLTSNSVAKAFDMKQESPATFERYGAGNENLVLARRLVEHGVNFVNVYIGGQPRGASIRAHNWDDHAVNWDIKQAMESRLPWFDHIVTTLIEDIYERGLDRKTLIVVASEFGRSPRLDTNNPGVLGRDHYPRAMSVLISGGGRERGDVIGATDSRGAAPIARHCDPHDFLATIYRYLGIDHQQLFVGNDNRPTPLTYGTPIEELV